MAEVGSCFNTTLFSRSWTKSRDLLLPICALNKTTKKSPASVTKLVSFFVGGFSFSEKLWYKESMVIANNSMLKFCGNIRFGFFCFF